MTWLKQQVNRSEGLTLIEIIVSLAIIALVVVMLVPIFNLNLIWTQKIRDNVNRLFAAEGDLEIIAATRQGILLEEGTFVPTLDGSIPVPVYDASMPIKLGASTTTVIGGVVELEDMLSFMAGIPTIRLNPIILNEGYPPDSVSNTRKRIDITGKNTSFIGNSPTQNSQIRVKDADGSVLGSWNWIRANGVDGLFKIPAVGSIDNQTATIYLEKSLLTSEGPYFIEIQSGSEIASTLLPVKLPEKAAVGEGSYYAVSSDDQTYIGTYWENRSSALLGNLNSIIFAYYPNDITKNKYISVGDAGRIFTWKDYESWTARSSGVTADINKVSLHRNSDEQIDFVAVGDNKTILFSTDAENWSVASVSTEIAAMPAFNLMDVCWNPIIPINDDNEHEGYMAVGSNGVILYSFDGQNWALYEKCRPEYVESANSSAYGAIKFDGILDAMAASEGPIEGSGARTVIMVVKPEAQPSAPSGNKIMNTVPSPSVPYSLETAPNSRPDTLMAWGARQNGVGTNWTLRLVSSMMPDPNKLGPLGIELGDGDSKTASTGTDSAWQIIACRLSGSSPTVASHRLFINGPRIDSFTIVGSNSVNTVDTLGTVPNIVKYPFQLGDDYLTRPRLGTVGPSDPAQVMSYPFKGEIAEVLVYDTALSESIVSGSTFSLEGDLERVEQQLASQYGISMNYYGTDPNNIPWPSGFSGFNPKNPDDVSLNASLVMWLKADDLDGDGVANASESSAMYEGDVIHNWKNKQSIYNSLDLWSAGQTLNSIAANGESSYYCLITAGNRARLVNLLEYDLSGSPITAFQRYIARGTGFALPNNTRLPVVNYHDVAFNSPNFIAVGDNGVIIRSPGTVSSVEKQAHEDGFWYPIVSGTSYNLWAVNYNENCFYAVGDNNTIRISSDNGVTWSGISTAVTCNFRDIALQKAD